MRLTTLMGEGDIVITRHFIELGRTGRIKFQVGSGQNRYDLIYAGNAAEGHIQAAHVRHSIHRLITRHIAYGNRLCSTLPEQTLVCRIANVLMAKLLT